MTLPELLASLERAEGPSRELDAKIAIAAGAMRLPGPYGADIWHYPSDAAGVWSCGYGNPPAYTSSIDAALSLVPEGWDWCIACISGKWDAQVGEADTFMAEGAGSNGSAAIALTLAALKARA